MGPQGVVTHRLRALVLASLPTCYHLPPCDSEWPLKHPAAISSIGLVTTCISYFSSSVMNLRTDAN